VLEKQAGLKLDRDYKVVAVGGGMAREKALIEGKIAGAVLSAPSDLRVKAAGGNILADAAAQLGGYQGSAYATRRSWARNHEKELIGFIRGIVAAHDVIFTDKAAAIAVLKKRIKNLSDQSAETIYRSLTTGAGGLNRKAEINVAGAENVLKLRSKYATPKKTLTDAKKYYDLTLYGKAIGK
jgi:ABC-type nitrate/sulfonate/bicarbonate transport system substrate-binding protein